MKKMISVIMFFILIFSAAYAADFGVIGEVLTTDIICFIDEQPISSYNINGFTYVIAEELGGYGFSVLWNAEKRTLSVNRDKEADRIFPSIDIINVKKGTERIGDFRYNVYSTDIVTYLNGEKIDACNVNGRTLINAEFLSSCGLVSYNNDIRTIKVDLVSFDAAEYKKGETVSLPCEKIEGKITYTGETKDNLPNGYGTIKEEYEYTNGLMSSEAYYTSGLFKDGKKNGYISFAGTKIPHNGSDRRKREYFSLTEYENDEIADYSLSLTYMDGQLEVRSEQTKNYKRECVIDPTYKYGYRIEKEGYTNSWGEITSYEKIPTPEIKAVDVGEITKVYDVDGNLYVFGKNIFENAPYSSDVPLLTDGNSISKRNNFILENGKLFRIFSNGEKGLISEDVTDFSASSLYLMFIKADNSVYTARLQHEEGSGSSWIDGCDMSEPVKVFENAKYISNKGRYCVIDENNTLWCWSSPYYKTPFDTAEKESPFTVYEPVKIAENVIKAECASGFIAYVKTDNSLYITKEAEPNENIFGITEETKVLDDVIDFSVSQRKLFAVKSDGTLWTMGKTDDFTLGIPFLNEASKMTQVTVFGK